MSWKRNVCLFLALLALCVLLFRYLTRESPPEPTPEAQVRQQLMVTVPTTQPPRETQPEPDAPYVSPIDFAALQEQNSEIIAWLDIPGTVISYPILRSETDNGFYLNHNVDRLPDASGTLFVEDYNSRELDDPVTVVYGHRMPSGTFFGTLQTAYQDYDAFVDHGTVHLYLPQREETYRVIAAVPYNNSHILYNYDFSQQWEYYAFFDNIYTVRSIIAQLDWENYPEFGEKCLILSTCLAGNRTNRFLVIGKEIAAS